MIGYCKNCKALVVWVPTTAGPDKLVPVEPQPRNVAITVDGETVRVIQARVLHPRECSTKSPTRPRGGSRSPATGSARVSASRATAGIDGPHAGGAGERGGER